MIQNFSEIREQLEQLAPVINAYKSEAVQLRIVELVFSRPTPSAPPQGGSEQAQGDTTPKSEPATEGSRKVRKSSVKKAGRPGPGATVDALITEGYFKTPRGAADVLKHCRDSKVLSYSTSDIAVALSRAVKSGKLKREKTADDQFSYSQV